MSLGDMKSLLRTIAPQQDSDKSILTAGLNNEISVLLSLDHLLWFAYNASLGFEYLQTMKFVHRDLACRNLLVSATFVAKIGDFGLLLFLFLFLPYFS